MPRTIRLGYTVGKPAGLVLAVVAGHLGGVKVVRAARIVLPGFNPPELDPLAQRVARDAEALGRLARGQRGGALDGRRRERRRLCTGCG